MNRHVVFGWAATLAVAAGISLGFWSTGGRGRQRDITADERRGEDLAHIANDVQQWYIIEKEVPRNLDVLRRIDPGVNLHDPLTSVLYEYKFLGGMKYQLCATFTFDTTNRGANGAGTVFGYHTAGRQCFDLDASRGYPYSGRWR